jgi:hypothetical protein
VIPYNNYKLKLNLDELEILRQVNIYNNEILNAIIDTIPYQNLDISHQINNIWYKFKFVKMLKNTLVFEQYTTTPPQSGNMIKTIRYVYIEFA